MKHSNWLTKAVIFIFISISALCVCSGSNPETPNKDREKQRWDSIDNARHLRVMRIRDSLRRDRLDTFGTITFRDGRLFEMLRDGFSKTNIPVARVRYHPDFFPEIYRSVFQRHKYINPKDTFKYDYKSDTIFVNNCYSFPEIERTCKMWSSRDSVYYIMGDSVARYLRRGPMWFDEFDTLVSLWEVDSIRKIYNIMNAPSIFRENMLYESSMRFVIRDGKIIEIDTISNIVDSHKRYPLEEDDFFNSGMVLGYYKFPTVDYPIVTGKH